MNAMPLPPTLSQPRDVFSHSIIAGSCTATDHRRGGDLARGRGTYLMGEEARL